MIDLITSLFQAGAVFFVCLNIRRLLIDKSVKGISIAGMIYFTIWGYWGIYMFWKLDCFWSMVTNIGIAVAYTIWMVIYTMYALIDNTDSK